MSHHPHCFGVNIVQTHADGSLDGFTPLVTSKIL
jgi:hypothetical protein